MVPFSSGNTKLYTLCVAFALDNPKEKIINWRAVCKSRHLTQDLAQLNSSSTGHSSLWPLSFPCQILRILTTKSKETHPTLGPTNQHTYLQNLNLPPPPPSSSSQISINQQSSIPESIWASHPQTSQASINGVSTSKASSPVTAEATSLTLATIISLVTVLTFSAGLRATSARDPRWWFFLPARSGLEKSEENYADWIASNVILHRLLSWKIDSLVQKWKNIKSWRAKRDHCDSWHICFK